MAPLTDLVPALIPAISSHTSTRQGYPVAPTSAANLATGTGSERNETEARRPTLGSQWTSADRAAASRGASATPADYFDSVLPQPGAARRPADCPRSVKWRLTCGFL